MCDLNLVSMFWIKLLPSISVYYITIQTIVTTCALLSPVIFSVISQFPLSSSNCLHQLVRFCTLVSYQTHESILINVCHLLLTTRFALHWQGQKSLASMLPLSSPHLYYTSPADISVSNWVDVLQKIPPPSPPSPHHFSSRRWSLFKAYTTPFNATPLFTNAFHIIICTLF